MLGDTANRGITDRVCGNDRGPRSPPRTTESATPPRVRRGRASGHHCRARLFRRHRPRWACVNRLSRLLLRVLGAHSSHVAGRRQRTADGDNPATRWGQRGQKLSSAMPFLVGNWATRRAGSGDSGARFGLNRQPLSVPTATLGRAVTGRISICDFSGRRSRRRGGRGWSRALDRLLGRGVEQARVRLCGLLTWDEVSSIASADGAGDGTDTCTDKYIRASGM